ncbi:hypothetical protein [Endozoicomonas sp. YOMI1]|uniref:hypothetical protein n=1 Tax=Endozoicomonas sp. YOMI1 TaxID=2828739 RepID=UPI0021475935|nr:hypothetical protein [Endozoicomonas sp. YOMI1]
MPLPLIERDFEGALPPYINTSHFPERKILDATITANKWQRYQPGFIRDGSVINVKGESAGVGQKAFIRDEIKGTAPEPV